MARQTAYFCRVSDTRPANATPYTALDVMGATAAAIKFNNVGPAGGKVYITSMFLRGDVAAVPAGMSTTRYHLYNREPADIADNAAYDLVAADRDAYQGYVDVGTPSDLGSTIFGQSDSLNHPVNLAPGCSDLWAFRQTLGGFTPAGNSEVFTTDMHTLSTEI